MVECLSMPFSLLVCFCCHWFALVRALIDPTPCDVYIFSLDNPFRMHPHFFSGGGGLFELVWDNLAGVAVFTVYMPPTLLTKRGSTPPME